MIIGAIPVSASPIGAVQGSAAAAYDAIVRESISFDDTLIVDVLSAVLEQFALGDVVTTTVSFGLSVTETAAFNDLAVLVWNVFVDETLTLNETPTASYVAMVSVAEHLVLDGTHTTLLQALSAVAESIALDDRFARAYREQISETATFSDMANSLLRAAVTVAETVGFSETAVASAQVTLLVEESMTFDDAVTTQAALQAAIRERIPMYVRVRVADDYYSGFCMQAESKAMTEYSSFPFNSFAKIGGKYYGAADSGLYLLEGADDDGDAIEAHLRTGLFRMKGGKLARAPTMYIGYTSDGQLVLKMTTTSDSGQKAEYWYPLIAQTADVAREARIKVGKGLASVYWQFEIHNKAGADFSLDVVQLHALSLDRRIR